MSDLRGPERILKVTVVQYYVVPMHDDTHSKINGWTIPEVIRDWFRRTPLWSFHATRNSHKVYGREPILKIEVVEEVV